MFLITTNLDSAAAISDSGVDSSLGTTTAISAAAIPPSSAAMLSWESERELVADPTGLGHLSTAWSSGSSSILVMEGEPPRLPDGDGVDDEDEERQPPFEEDLRMRRIILRHYGVMRCSYCILLVESRRPCNIVSHFYPQIQHDMGPFLHMS